MDASHNLPAYSVSEISQGVKQLVEDHFGYVRVRGELSGFKRHTSGHLYFSLKDERSVLSGVCWKGVAGSLSFQPEDGLEVICIGRITTYAGQSKYQIVVQEMLPAGVGALMALLEKRRQSLSAEGLFDEARKQALPFMPQRIGVVTSATGAVIRDILHRIRERFPCQVLLWPVAVQGEQAASQIAHAIDGFNHAPDAMKPELLIVGRGGGSLEDLWAFNEEVVVRAIAASTIPVISAVGHETDTTLSDFAADTRAPTPTAAAEMAVPVRTDWLLSLQETGHRLNGLMQRQWQHHQLTLQSLVRAIPHPMRLVEQQMQRLDDRSEWLTATLPSLLRRRTEQLGALRLSALPLKHQQRQSQERLSYIMQRLRHTAADQQTHAQYRLERAAASLEQLSYKRILERGFVLANAPDKTLIRSKAEAADYTQVTLTWHDGSRKAALSGAPKIKSSNNREKKQGSLFD